MIQFLLFSQKNRFWQKYAPLHYGANGESLQE